MRRIAVGAAMIVPKILRVMLRPIHAVLANVFMNAMPAIRIVAMSKCLTAFSMRIFKRTRTTAGAVAYSVRHRMNIVKTVNASNRHAKIAANTMKNASIQPTTAVHPARTVGICLMFRAASAFLAAARSIHAHLTLTSIITLVNSTRYRTVENMTIHVPKK